MSEQDEIDELLDAGDVSQQNGQGVVADSGIRDEVTGQFVDGHPKVGGRTKGSSVDLMAICRRRAKEEGTSVDEMVWAAFQGMATRVKKTGDAAAGKVVLDRACGMQEKAPIVQVGVTVGANDREVVLPPRRELAQQLLDIHETATKLLGSEDEIDALLA